MHATNSFLLLLLININICSSSPNIPLKDFGVWKLEDYLEKTGKTNLDFGSIPNLDGPSIDEKETEIEERIDEEDEVDKKEKEAFLFTSEKQVKQTTKIVTTPFTSSKSEGNNIPLTTSSDTMDNTSTTTKTLLTKLTTKKVNFKSSTTQRNADKLITSKSNADQATTINNDANISTTTKSSSTKGATVITTTKGGNLKSTTTSGKIIVTTRTSQEKSTTTAKTTDVTTSKTLSTTTSASVSTSKSTTKEENTLKTDVETTTAIPVKECDLDEDGSPRGGSKPCWVVLG